MAHFSFLQLDSIKGSCSEEGHKDWIAVSEYQYSLQHTLAGDMHSQGAITGGIVKQGDLVIRKSVDASSPVLALYCCKSQNIKKAVLEICRMINGKKVPYIKYVMSDVAVTSLAPGGKGGDKVELVGLRDTRDTVITGVEMFRKQMDECMAGDNVGLLLRGVEKEDLERGMCLVAPKSVTPHKKFKGSVYILSKEEGGRHTPFFNGYRPQFYFRTTDVTGVATLPEGREMVMPGDNVDMVVELITPIAMEKELRFAIREGGRTVGAGVVTEIVE